MYEKEISMIVKETGQSPKETVEKLLNLKKELEKSVSDTNPVFHDTAAMIYEAVGDVWNSARKGAEAEKAYITMLEHSVKLYEMDKERFSYRLGFSYYKRAHFYQVMLQLNIPLPTPRELDEQGQKLFGVIETFYKNAIACTMSVTKKGTLRYVELQSLVLSQMALLYASVGRYEEAIRHGKDGIQLEKAIYEKLDDKAHSFRLGHRMNAMASIYSIVKKPELAAEMLEDGIFVLEEHEAEDAVTFGVILCRCYINLGGCYSQSEENSSLVEEAFQKGLQYILDVNEKTGNRQVNDVITSYMIVGDYYKKVKNEESAKMYYRLALKRASELWEKTKLPAYEKIVKRLLPLV